MSISSQSYEEPSSTNANDGQSELWQQLVRFNNNNCNQFRTYNMQINSFSFVRLYQLMKTLQLTEIKIIGMMGL